MNMQIKNATKKIKKSRFIINKKIYIFLNLTNNNKKWHKTIKKTIKFKIVVMLRNLFFTIFLECEFFES